jgi:adenylylsulfate kinase
MESVLKILIMGLPENGKTYLAERLQRQLGCAWFNADKIRLYANDWQFNMDARLRQARRMRNLADFEKAEGNTVICDFICPTKMTRYIFGADYTVWVNTKEINLYPDTTSIFEPPETVDYLVEKWYDDTHIQLAEAINRHRKIKYD